MDRFLEEQLKRIQELTRRMTGLEHRAAELSEELKHDRDAMHWGPLHEVRDLRTISKSQPPSDVAERRRVHRGTISRAHANDSPRRRRRSKRA